MKKPLIVANWKRYIETKDEALAAGRVLARGAASAGADIVICPPAIYIDALIKQVSRKGIRVGAQSVSAAEGPMHTGELSAAMLADMGVTHVIVGHSERRALGEDGLAVRARIESALAQRLSPILCIGESARDASGGHFDIITAQLREALPAKLSPSEQKRLVVAYEPLWAIGKTATEAVDPRALEETAIYIHKVLADMMGRTAALAVPVLYGGSVEEENAASLMGSGVSGFLIGHASVSPKSLLTIAKAAHASR